MFHTNTPNRESCDWWGGLQGHEVLLHTHENVRRHQTIILASSYQHHHLRWKVSVHIKHCAHSNTILPSTLTCNYAYLIDVVMVYKHTPVQSQQTLNHPFSPSTNIKTQSLNSCSVFIEIICNSTPTMYIDNNDMVQNNHNSKADTTMVHTTLQSGYFGPWLCLFLHVQSERNLVLIVL